MRDVTKISDIAYEDVADYLRLEYLDSDEINTLKTLMTVAKTYILQYTGRTEEEIDTYADLIIVMLILIQDMWDNRTMYVDKSNVNKTVESILNLHQVNLL